MSIRSKKPVTGRGTEEVLKQSDERFRSLIENSFDGIVLYEANGTMTYASPSIKRITREIVERHHGRIRVKSRKGEGAAFYVALPLVKEE